MSKVTSYSFAFTIFLRLVTLISARNVSFGLNCSGQKFTAKSTAFYPSTNPSEGGFYDCKGAPIQTLQQFIVGDVNYVSVAMDQCQHIKYGTEICIPELNEKYHKQIVFKVVDTASSFCCHAYSRINIGVSTVEDAFDASVNEDLTLYFSDLHTGSDYCT